MEPSKERKMIYQFNLKKEDEQPTEQQDETPEYVTAYQVGNWLGVFVVGPLVFMLCWNYVLPYLFAVKGINYLHAFCIIVILRFLKND